MEKKQEKNLTTNERIFTDNKNYSNRLIYTDSKFDVNYSQSKKENILQLQNKTGNSNSNFTSTEKLNNRKLEEMNEQERDLCEICCEDLIIGEVVYYCHCAKFFHPNCLINKISKNSENFNLISCSECQTKYNFASYTNSSSINSTVETSNLNNLNSTLVDTNINNLDNYNEMCGIAYHLSQEGLIEVIGKKNETIINNFSNEDISRIALSPITITTTPYSGKTKKQVSSNQKAEEYAHLQNTHTTPNNNRYVNVVRDMNLSGGTNHSPDGSFHGIRQHLSFYSPFQPENKINNSGTSKKDNFSIKLLSEKENEFVGNMDDIDKFFKTINFDGINENLNPNHTNNQISFRKIVFNDIENEDIPLDKENDDSYDKENCPPIPRESSKYSYVDPECNFCPIEINIEAGISHVVSDCQKIVEIPIILDFKVKDNIQNIFSKDFIVILNTISLNTENLFHIFKIITDSIGDNDRIFTNIFKFEKWITKEESKLILLSGNFNSYLMETPSLNYTEISKLICYCVDLSFENYTHIFSVILINDIDSIGADADYMEDIKLVANKLKESKVNLIKNFTINCIMIDHGRGGELKTQQNIKSISYFYDLSMLCMGYFFSPKDVNELNKSIYIVISLFEQTSFLNLKACIKGNKDPSVYLEIANYPSIKKQHNNFDIYLGNLLKKEKKFLNLTAVVILNNTDVSLNLPLLEVSLEYLGLKKEFTSTTSNCSLNSLQLQQNQNLMKNKTSSYSICIPVITRNKEIITSNSIFLRSCCSKIADKLSESLEFVKILKYDEALQYLYICKSMFEQTFKNQTGLIKYFKIFSDINHSFYPININMNNAQYFTTKLNTNSNNNAINNSSISADDSIYDLIKNINSSNISKIFNFCQLILLDINNLIEMIKCRNFNLITEFFTIKQSLMFYRPVHLSDERFLDDIIE